MPEIAADKGLKSLVVGESFLPSWEELCQSSIQISCY